MLTEDSTPMVYPDPNDPTGVSYDNPNMPSNDDQSAASGTSGAEPFPTPSPNYEPDAVPSPAPSPDYETAPPSYNFDPPPSGPIMEAVPPDTPYNPAPVPSYDGPDDPHTEEDGEGEVEDAL